MENSKASDLLRIDPRQETERIVEGIRDVVFNSFGDEEPCLRVGRG